MNVSDFVEIDSGAGLYYMDQGQAVEADRFVGRFRAVWQKVPPGEREIMGLHWAKRRQKMADIFARSATPISDRVEVPMVQVHLERVDFEAHGFSEPLGFYCGRTFSLTFWAVAVDLMDENTLDSLIAHELAHAYTDAAGIAKVVEDEEEEQVGQVMRSWGFDDTVIDDWKQRNRESARDYFNRRLESG